MSERLHRDRLHRPRPEARPRLSDPARTHDGSARGRPGWVALFRSLTTAYDATHTPVAQRREHCPATAEAAGSNPAGCASPRAGGGRLSSPVTEKMPARRALLRSRTTTAAIHRVTTHTRKEETPMNYLTRFARRRTAQRTRSRHEPGAELGRRLRLGRRRLDAPAPLPDPRLRGWLLLRGRADADPRERRRAVWRCVESGRRPRGRARSSRSAASGRARQERPGDLRARDGGLRHRGRDPPGRARRAAARCAAPARTCSRSRATSRASAAGAARCAAASRRGTSTRRRSSSPTRRSSTASATA